MFPFYCHCEDAWLVQTPPVIDLESSEVGGEVQIFVSFLFFFKLIYTFVVASPSYVLLLTVHILFRLYDDNTF